MTDGMQDEKRKAATTVVTMRMTREELSALDAAAAECDMSRSAYIRLAVSLASGNADAIGTEQTRSAEDKNRVSLISRTDVGEIVAALNRVGMAIGQVSEDLEGVSHRDHDDVRTMVAVSVSELASCEDLLDETYAKVDEALSRAVVKSVASSSAETRKRVSESRRVRDD